MSEEQKSEAERRVAAAVRDMSLPLLVALRDEIAAEIARRTRAADQATGRR
jgi:hypothetical protein